MAQAYDAIIATITVASDASQVVKAMVKSTTWEGLDTNSVTAANTEFVLTGGKTTDLGNYYDANYIISYRVYQNVG
jgi:hypothetical protein